MCEAHQVIGAWQVEEVRNRINQNFNENGFAKSHVVGAKVAQVQLIIVTTNELIDETLLSVLRAKCPRKRLLGGAIEKLEVNINAI